MNIQAIILGLLIPILIASLFHLIKGGPLWHLLVFIITSLIGFWVSHFVTDAMGLNTLTIGSLQVLWGSIGAVIGIFLGSWLFTAKREPPADEGRS